jgi:hypothetical protein
MDHPLNVKLPHKKGSALLTLIGTLMTIVGAMGMFVSLEASGYMASRLMEKTREVERDLREFAKAQSEYLDKNKTYAGANNTPVFAALNWEPVSRDYAFYCGKDLIRPSNFTVPRSAPDKDRPHHARPVAAADSFTCMAIGNIDHDEAPDIRAINERGELSIIEDDTQDLDVYGNMEIFIAISPALFIAGLFVLMWNRRRKRRNRISVDSV